MSHDAAKTSLNQLDASQEEMEKNGVNKLKLLVMK
jgi:hypothetical protein